MGANHRDRAGSNLTAAENVRWVFNKKSKLWVSQRKKSTGFEDKTLWEKLQLMGTLAIPLIIALATIGFGLLQVHVADVQHQQDQQHALDQQQATILQTYIDNIQDLLLNHHLRKSARGDDIAILARARTLTALQGLNPERKGRLLTFLQEAKLIGFADEKGTKHESIIDLYNGDLVFADLVFADLSYADLSYANLSNANLSHADLSHADLSNADLSGTILSGTILSSTNLSGANLSGAYLSGATLSGATLNGADLGLANLSGADLGLANLNGANLNGAYLSGATLSGANLSHAYLSGANLNGATLSGADLRSVRGITSEELEKQARSLKGAIMPDGSTHP